MRAMNSNSVHLIATDPPFNKGRDFHAIPTSLSKGASFHDRWRWDKDTHEEWHDQLQDDWPGVWAVIDWTRVVHSDAMAAFLCYMAVRLIEMHCILREDGSIYLHCDHTAAAYLKTLMDATFGESNAQNSLVWERIKGAGKGSQHRRKCFSRCTDTLLFYTKGKTWTFNTKDIAKFSDTLDASFSREDEKGKYKRRSPFRPPGLGSRPNLCYEYKGITPPHTSGWTCSKAKLIELDNQGELEWTPNAVWRKQRPNYGIIPSDFWGDITQAGGKERTGYPTQKPLSLYQQIIRASSNRDDIVFDPFAGCATTPVAAELEGRQWIACDL